jgi:DNA-binding IclR family transcriptional regulator
VLARHEGMVDNQRLRGIAGLHAADATTVLGRLRERGLIEPQGRGARTWYRLAIPLQEETGVQSGADIETSQPELWEELREIARPIREKLRQRKRPSVSERDGVIIKLCSHAPLALEDLVDLLGYAESSLRSPLQTLIKEGELQYQYPERPTHPHQRYRSVRGTERREGDGSGQ